MFNEKINESIINELQRLMDGKSYNQGVITYIRFFKNINMIIKLIKNKYINPNTLSSYIKAITSILSRVRRYFSNEYNTIAVLNNDLSGGCSGISYDVFSPVIWSCVSCTNLFRLRLPPSLFPNNGTRSSVTPGDLVLPAALPASLPTAPLINIATFDYLMPHVCLLLLLIQYMHLKWFHQLPLILLYPLLKMLHLLQTSGNYDTWEVRISQDK